jgi:prophage regulatory protein
MSHDRLIRIPEVENRVGLKKSAIYQRLDPKHRNYDPAFPKPIKLGSATVWPESEVQAWIDRTIQAAREGQVCGAPNTAGPRAG